MQQAHLTPQAVVVFADETAEWRVAGLRQIDRIKFATADYFRREGIAAPYRELGSLGDGPVLALSTRVVPQRNSIPGLLIDAAELHVPPKAVMEQFRGGNWFYLEKKSDLPRATEQLLTGTGKSQDGVISRCLNRPLSRALSRLLVRTSLRPNQITLGLMALPLAGVLFLLRGDYFDFALGAILFQLHSALDGCDGEVARVKYLESESGRKLDEVCDRLSTMLYAVALGFGLGSPFYVFEGVGAALLIGVAETFLTRTRIDDDAAVSEGRYREYVRANRQSFNHGDQLKLWLIKHVGLLSLGDGAVRIFGEATKRDVFNFVFLLLALCGLAGCILHLIAFSAFLIAALALKELFTSALGAKSAA